MLAKVEELIGSDASASSNDDQPVLLTPPDDLEAREELPPPDLETGTYASDANDEPNEKAGMPLGKLKQTVVSGREDLPRPKLD